MEESTRGSTIQNWNPDATPTERGNSPVQSWIRFEEDDKTKDAIATIVPTQTIQVDNILNSSHSLTEVLSASDVELPNESKATLEISSSPSSGFTPGRTSPNSVLPPPPRPNRKSPTTEAPLSRSSCPPDVGRDNGHSMQVIPLSETALQQRPVSNHGISQGFSNGDVIVTLLPVNNKCPWVTKAQFKPELVPEELMAQGLTLTVEDYVLSMQVLVNDVRFNLYNVCYKRVLILWIMLGFIILLSLLFSGVRGLALFGGGIVWLIINAVGIFVCMWVKIKLYRMLEQCMASVNAMLYKHRILIGLDDRGKISCHKVNLIFIYFDVSYCIKYLRDMLENEERMSVQETATADPSRQPTIDQSRMDIDTSDIIITGSNSTRLSQKEKYAEKLFLRYSQRWVKEFVRKRLDLRLPLHPDGTVETGPPSPPRHCGSARCPCQFIEEHLRFKPTTKCNIRELFS
ncbi:transmembrane protein 268-like [Uloborus diversus]|uniref:transmembrane protein 268-like n=1 Tax=Uloborus diversus TaxID=327109 RepID=UPI0024099B65|nr:transmembrane protein 268-like [Uloborus diversus]